MGPVPLPPFKPSLAFYVTAAGPLTRVFGLPYGIRFLWSVR